MSSIFSPPSFRSSVTLADLPQICDDLECLVPFGPACHKCSLGLNITGQARRAPRPSDRTKEWVDEIQVNKRTTAHAGQILGGDADEENGSITRSVWDEDDDGISEHVSDGDETSEPGRGPREEEHEADADTGTGGSPQTRRLAQSAYSPSGDSSGACTSSSPVMADSPPLPERLDPWLTDIFKSTLQGQRGDSYFVGGADERDDDRTCSRCGQVPVEHPELHRLKCEFAHHEAERMEEGVQKQVERWGRRRARGEMDQ
ncbi:hypothetical protein PZA11_006051 [Diplocarpon coronariae]